MKSLWVLLATCATNMVVRIQQSLTGKNKETGKRYFVALFTLFLTVGSAKTEESARFQSYLVEVDQHQKAAHPVLESPKDRMYRTILSEIYLRAHTVDFAGHYKVALIECAAGCRFGAAIDIRTGKVAWFPYKMLFDLPPDGWNSIVFCRNSTLIRFKGDFEGSLTNEERFYDFRDGYFRLVKRTELPMPAKDLKPNPVPEWALTGAHLVDPEFCDPGEAP